jgi:predicted RecB family nuclease
MQIVDLREIGDDQRAVAETLAAMVRGVDVTEQATLANGRWFGRADVLRRVERAGKFGGWSYEVYDCKLARETKATTILQLSLYSELLAIVQGVLPESMYVIPFGSDFRPERCRVLDFAAYYRYIKARLEKAVEQKPATNAEPTAHCDICRWWPECDGSREGYAKVREQARVQVAGRNQGRPVHEVLEVTDEHGFCLLPEPSSGDIFFDLEGDPFVGVSGREYLFGFVCENKTGEPAYESRWAMTAKEEKRAFEWFVDRVMARWKSDPAMHIYHFTPYEPSALKRLMGRYATREDEIDQMFHAGLFIDLHTVLKRAVRAGVEQYSLKALEGKRTLVPA